MNKALSLWSLRAASARAYPPLRRSILHRWTSPSSPPYTRCFSTTRAPAATSTVSGTMQKPSTLYEKRIKEGLLMRDEKQKGLVEKLDHLHAQLHQKHASAKPQSIYIYGGVGCGKTMLMDVFFDSVNERMVRKEKTHFNAFMQAFHRRIHELRKVEPKKDNVPQVIEEIVARSRLICFDEFQVTDIADAMILKRLFEALMQHGVVIIATSNRPPSDLYENGINRSVFLPFIDFLTERCIVWNMDSSSDYRLSGEKMPNVYIVSQDMQATRQQLEELFSELTHGEVAEQTFIEAGGRMILVPKTARGVAFFTFKDLCVKELGPVEMMEIARTYHTVFVSNVPQLDMEVVGRNAIRRFIMLVDELYQHKAKLICSASAPAQDLLLEKKRVRDGEVEESMYFGVDEFFAFDRTASRLLEMQTRQYLQQQHISKPTSFDANS